MSYKLTQPGKPDALYATAALALAELTDDVTGIWIVNEQVPDGMGDTAIIRADLKRLAQEEADAPDPEEFPDGLRRITRDPDVCGGRPCLAGTRMEPHHVVALGGVDEALAAYPHLVRDQIVDAFVFAARPRPRITMCEEKS